MTYVYLWLGAVAVILLFNYCAGEINAEIDRKELVKKLVR